MKKVLMKKFEKHQNIIFGLIIALILIIILVIYLDVIREQRVVDQENLLFLRAKTQHTDIGVHDAKILIDEKPEMIIVDVSPYYDKGHIPHAINYYIGDGSLDSALKTLDKNATYLVYCHFESASRTGVYKFLKAGFENVYRLEGDFPAWEDAGYTIEL